MEDTISNVEYYIDHFASIMDEFLGNNSDFTIGKTRMFFMHSFVFTQNFILIELVSPISFKKS